MTIREQITHRFPVRRTDAQKEAFRRWAVEECSKMGYSARVEEVKKHARKGKAVDDAYLEELFGEMTSLYRLDQVTATDGKADLGPLPDTAVALLGGLALVWVGIGSYTGLEAVKKKKAGKR